MTAGITRALSDKHVLPDGAPGAITKVRDLEEVLNAYKCPELCAKILRKTSAALSLLFVSNETHTDDRTVRFASYPTDADDVVETGELIYKQFEAVCESFCDFNPEVFNMVHAFIEKSMEIYFAPSERMSLQNIITKFEWSMSTVITSIDQALKDAESLGEYKAKVKS